MFCQNCGNQLLENASTCSKCRSEVKNNSGKDFVLYDYITIQTTQRLAPEVADYYNFFGWEITACNNHNYMGNTATLSFRRDRKIKNKQELLRLQPKLDDAMVHLRVLENKKTSKATGVAIGIGTLGALTFGGGMSMAMLLPQSIGAMIGGIALGLLGIGVCGLAYMTYKKIFIKKSVEMENLIIQKKEEVSNLCDQAKKSLLK